MTLRVTAGVLHGQSAIDGAFLESSTQATSYTSERTLLSFCRTTPVYQADTHHSRGSAIAHPLAVQKFHFALTIQVPQIQDVVVAGTP